MNLITYLINLDGSTERYAQAKVQLDKQNITFEWVSAFDGRQLDLSTVHEYDEARALRYMGRTLKGGELGCYFSHLDCARRFLATNADYGMVLEDDFNMIQDAHTLIHATLMQLEANKANWYLMHIGAERQKITSTLFKVQHQGIHQHIVRAHYFPMTTTGLIWSRQGAQAFLNEHHTIFAPVDNYFRYWLTRNDKGLSISPPIVTASGAQSEIDTGTHRKKIGRSPWFALIKQKRLWADKILASIHKYQS